MGEYEFLSCNILFVDGSSLFNISFSSTCRRLDAHVRMEDAHVRMDDFLHSNTYLVLKDYLFQFGSMPAIRLPFQKRRPRPLLVGGAGPFMFLMRLYFHTISTTSNARAVDVEPQRIENRNQITLTPTGEASGAPKLRQSTDSITSDSDSPRTSSTGGRKIRKTKTRTGTSSRNEGPHVLASGSVGITDKTQPGQSSAQVLRREKTSNATHLSSSLSHRGATHASLAAKSEVVGSAQVFYSATAKGGETLLSIEQLVATQSSDAHGGSAIDPLLYKRGWSTAWNKNPHGQHVCSHTSNDTTTDGWWRLEFKDGKKHCLSKMEIWNRYDCCQGRLNNGFVLLDPDVDDPVTKIDLLAAAGKIQLPAEVPSVATADNGTDTDGTVVDLSSKEPFQYLYIIGPEGETSLTICGAHFYGGDTCPEASAKKSTTATEESYAMGRSCNSVSVLIAGLILLSTWLWL